MPGDLQGARLVFQAMSLAGLGQAGGLVTEPALLTDMKAGAALR